MTDRQLNPADSVRRLTAGGLDRSYLVHVPPQYDGSKLMPVVLAFHGGLSNAGQMASFCGLSDKSDAAGFICVYPNGTGSAEGAFTWNGGNCCGYARQNQIDDVAFVRAVLADLREIAAIDPKRVFATGMSNGAIFSYRLASEMSDQIAAIAPVAGSMGTETCNPTRPVSIIHFHGTDDEFCPFEGGRGRKSVSGTVHYSLEHSIQAWVKANGCPASEFRSVCPGAPVVTTAQAEEESVIRKSYGPGRGGSEVVLYLINGGGHTWPGRHPRLFFLGKSTTIISANDLMWDFFQRHPME